MTVLEILIGIYIHLIVPMAGLIVYRRLVRKMRTENVPHPPVADMFLVFVNYGGLLLILLTSFIWYWSGMASLGMSYLLLVAPFVMAGIAYRNYNSRRLSSYHNAMFKAGLLYFLVLPTAMLLVYFTS